MRATTARLIFVFLVEMGFHHVGQVNLELLTSGDPPTLASQSAGITGVSHCALPRKRNSNERLKINVSYFLSFRKKCKRMSSTPRHVINISLENQNGKKDDIQRTNI